MIDTDFQLIKQRARFRVSMSLSEDAERASAGRVVVDARFTKVRGLRGRVTVGERRYGGAALPFKWPTGVEFGNVTLEAGASQSPDLARKFVESAEAAAGITDLLGFKGDVAIRELDRTDQCINEWILSRAWVVEWSPGEYDGNSDRFLIERVVLAHDAIVGGQRSRASTGRRVRVADIGSILGRIL